MGCNCKTQSTFNKLVENYGDEYPFDNVKVKDFGYYLKQVFLFPFYLLFGMVAGVAFLLMAIPLIIYVFFCILFGKEPRVKIPFLKNKKKG